MSFAEFAASLERDPSPSATLNPGLQALWYDAKGDWPRAHELAQEDEGRRGCWVHAYLHRKEGDLLNASYWYAKARRSRPGDDVTLAVEWEQMVRELLNE